MVLISGPVPSFTLLTVNGGDQSTLTGMVELLDILPSKSVTTELIFPAERVGPAF